MSYPSMRRHSKGGGGRVSTASARPPTWMSGELPGGAGPPGEGVWLVTAALRPQAVAGLFKRMRRAFSLTSDHWLCAIGRPGNITRITNFPAQLLEDWCG